MPSTAPGTGNTPKRLFAHSLHHIVTTTLPKPSPYLRSGNCLRSATSHNCSGHSSVRKARHNSLLNPAIPVNNKLRAFFFFLTPKEHPNPGIKEHPHPLCPSAGVTDAPKHNPYILIRAGFLCTAAASWWPQRQTEVSKIEKIHNQLENSHTFASKPIKNKTSRWQRKGQAYFLCGAEESRLPMLPGNWMAFREHCVFH